MTMQHGTVNNAINSIYSEQIDNNALRPGFEENCMTHAVSSETRKDRKTLRIRRSFSFLTVTSQCADKCA